MSSPGYARQAATFAAPIRRLGFLRGTARIIAGWNRKMRQRRALLALDDRMLKDIGLTRGDAEHAFEGKWKER